MASVTERLTLLLTANADGLISVLRDVGATSTATFGKVEGEAEAAGTQAGTKFGGAFGGTAIAGFATLAATAAAFKGISFGEQSIQTAVDFNRATEAVNATLAATGGVSGATANSIERMSKEIEGTQQIFAGTVKQGAALLLTFTDIQNQAGAGNNIFDRTLKTAAAVSNVFGKDITTSITQIGRALENPQAGLQALSRSGLTLTQQDKQRIIDLAKQGDLLGAQKALLDALQGRGLIQQGEALAKADPLQQFSVASAELKKTLGEDLLPAVSILLRDVTGVFHVIEDLPAPLRETAELLTVAGLALLPILGIRNALGAFNAIKLNNSPEAATANAEALDTAAASGAAKIAESGSAVADGGAAAGEHITLSSDSIVAAGEDAGASILAAGEATAATIESSLATIAVDAAGTATLGTSFAVDSAGIASVGAAFDEAASKIVDSGTVAGEAISAGAVELETTAPIIGEAISGGADALARAGLDAGASISAGGDDAARKIVAAGGAAGEEIGAGGAAGGGASALGGLAGGAAVGERAAPSGNLLGDVGAGVYGGTAIAAAETTAPVTGLAAALGTSIPLLGAFVLGGITVNNLLDSMGNKAPKIDALSRSLDTFFKTGKTGGSLQTAIDNLDPRVGRIADQQSSFQQKSTGGLPILSQGEGLGIKIGDFLTGQAPKINTFNATIAELDQKMAELIGSGNIQEANALFQQLVSKDGLGFDQFPQFKAAFDDYMSSIAAGKNKVLDLADAFGHLSEAAAGFKAELAVGDAFDSLHAAQKTLATDKANVAGTGPAAVAATDAVRQAHSTLAQQETENSDNQLRLRDSYISLQDAQDQVTTSTHTLQQAQEALDLYNSPRGALERSLQLDVIQRRVVTTPGESDQKQLDLLTNQDNNNQKQQQLQDAVTNAARGQRDAIKGVADAQQSIIDQQVKLREGGDKIKTDYDNIAKAIKNVKTVHDDAAAAEASDLRKVQGAEADLLTAINNDQNASDAQREIWLGQLDKLALKYAPGSTLYKNIHAVNVLLQQQTLGVPGATFDPKTGVVSAPTIGPHSTGPTLQAPDVLPKGYGSLPTGYTPHAAGAFEPQGIFFADGGLNEQHVAQIAKVGTTPRVWAEPETGGEAYIPLAGGKRTRSQQILEQVAVHFGYHLEKYADGAVNAPALESSGDATSRIEAFGNGGVTMMSAPTPAVHYAAGGFTQPPPSQPHADSPGSASVVVNQHNEFHGTDHPSTTDLEFANRELGWRLSRGGRR